MPKKSSAGRSGTDDQYWQKRLRSSAFRRNLTALVVRELQSLSAERVKDVVDPGLVRTMLLQWDVRMVNRELVADFIIHANHGVARRLNRGRRSLLGLLDRQLIADVDAILEEDGALSTHAEAFVGKLMQQEFVRRLFTDIIFTAIVSFYQKVNPLFGALTVQVLEEQIKGFISLFMPMLQKQATGFAVSRENQRILFDFTRAIVRQLLDEPLHHYADLVSPGHRRKAEALIRHAIGNPAGNAKLDAAIRRATLAAWDDLYQAIEEKQVGEVLRLQDHAGWLAERLSDVLLPALARPQVRRFIAAEMAMAAAGQR
jgi:hypothetical protein